MESYRPLLASWLIELTLSLGWYKKIGVRHRGHIFEDDGFSSLTSIHIELDSDDKGKVPREDSQ